MTHRIVITGMGAVCPLGLSASEAWNNAINGVCGIGPITLFDSSHLSIHIAGEVKGFQPGSFMDPKDARRRDRFEQFAVAAAKQALEQSGLSANHCDPQRVGVVISSAVGGIATTQEIIRTMDREGARRISPFGIPMLMANGAAGLVSIDNGFRGPSLSVASACASGGDGIGAAWLMLRAGVIDAALAGAAEATVTEIGIAAFDRIGAISHRSADVTPAPFDLHRDGLVVGEGAAVLVLETEEHARHRGADILAEVAGYGSTADAYHITAPSEDGSGGAQAMRLALQSAGLNADQVSYVNAHGTGTQLNDLSETKAIKSALGEHAYRVPISSTKSMTGHMMGATAALETVFCVQAIRESCLPPTIHYQTPDPQCDLDYIPNQAREARVDVALTNAFGFGGHNAVLAIRRYA